MRTQATDSRWEHAHQCRACGHIVRIDDIDAKVIAAGVISCERCDASGPVNLQIVEGQQISAAMQFLRGKRQ